MAVTAQNIVDAGGHRAGQFSGIEESERLQVAALALEHVENYASTAPDSAKREAGLRCYGFLLQTPNGFAIRQDAQGNTYAVSRLSVIVDSGAAAALSPWRKHTGSVVG